MDNNTERFGLSFCSTMGRNHVKISPGLASLINGSTYKTSMKRKTYEALIEIEVAKQRCRIVRSKNKTILLFAWSEEKTPFTQACSLLTRLGEVETMDIPRIISVDAMVVLYEKGEVVDHIGCIKASNKHEIVVYEDRGENLSFLKHHDSTKAIQNHAANPETLSGSERLQLKTAAERAAAREKMTKSSESQSGVSALINTISAAAQSIPGRAMRKLRKIRQAQNLIGEPPRVLKKSQPTHSRPCSGRVSPPLLLPANGPKDHIINAFLEFKALTKATLEVNQTTCRNILQSFHLGSDEFLRVQLEEAEAAIYDNKTSTVIKGEMGHHMAAYSGSAGFVALDEEETERQGRVVFKTPPNDPIVVTARCTRVMLEDRILNMAEAISGTCGMGDPWESWTVPTINWVNGVPGCGKTTWVINQFDAENDLIVTTTTEAAKDLRSKLANRIGTDTKTKVRTMASVLVNGMRKQNRRCTRLLVDEALMNHFGAIVMAMRLSGAEKILLIGDINQLPYIDRENLFAMQYTRPSLVTTISQELLCTHRNPMDVAYALSEIYSGIYSSRSQVHSLERRSYTGLVIPGTLPNTLYLVYTQAEKKSLTSQGYGSGPESRILTVHEAQGLTYGRVVIMRTTTEKHKIYDSVQHAVVAVSRHTESCVYYTDDCDDATGRLIESAMAATTKRIKEYNLKMAIRNRDATVVEALIKANQHS